MRLVCSPVCTDATQGCMASVQTFSVKRWAMPLSGGACFREMTAPVIRAYHGPEAACVRFGLGDGRIVAAEAGVFLDGGTVGDMLLIEGAGIAGGALDMLPPDLGGRRRLDLVGQDLAYLGLEPLAVDAPPAFSAGAAVDLPRALGWLYVEEGSNMGA